MHRLYPADSGYPRRLVELFDPPPLTSSGPLVVDRKIVAIVGSRDPIDGVRTWVHDVARRLAERGVVIISGGAIGVDRAAHEGALDAGGTTWAVLPHGASQSMATPLTNRDLFERIRASPTSRLLYPFSDEVTCDRQTPRARNKTLVGLADVVLVVQARLVSGSRNALSWADQTGRPLFIVPGLPWAEPFSGSRDALLRGRGRPLIDEEELFTELGLTAPTACDKRRMSSASRVPAKKSTRPRKAHQMLALNPEEKLIVSHCSMARQHIDAIASRAGLRIPTLMSALLTLTTKNVLVEGPDGFFGLRKEV